MPAASTDVLGTAKIGGSRTETLVAEYTDEYDPMRPNSYEDCNARRIQARERAEAERLRVEREDELPERAQPGRGGQAAARLGCRLDQREGIQVARAGGQYELLLPLRVLEGGFVELGHAVVANRPRRARPCPTPGAF